MRKRSMFKRSSLILSAVISMAAPMGKANQRQPKNLKPCKKSKSPQTLMADDPAFCVAPLPGGAALMEVLLRPPGTRVPPLPGDTSAEPER